MSARTKARRRALDALFEADVRGLPALEVLAAMERRRSEVGEPALNPYTRTLVEGVVQHREAIDEQLASLSIGWTLDRMPVVDRNLLRIGAFELVYGQQVPTAVALSEAVALAEQLSTDESPRFVNGLLSRIAGMNPREESGTGAGQG